MKRFLGFLFLLFTVPLFGQGIAYHNVVLTNGGYPFATVRVCTEPATGTPCTPLANVFSNQGLTLPLTNPFNTDANGNYMFFADPTVTYHIQISGLGLQTYDIPYVSIGSGSGGGGGGGGSNVPLGAAFQVPVMNSAATAYVPQTKAVADSADSGIVGDGSTDVCTTFQAWIDAHPGQHLLLRKTAAPLLDSQSLSVDYYSSCTFHLKYDATWLDGGVPNNWSGSPTILFAAGVTGVQIDPSCQGCMVTGIGMIGGGKPAANATACYNTGNPIVYPFTGAADGLLVYGGEPTIKYVNVSCFSRDGIHIDGTNVNVGGFLGQPDDWTIEHGISSGNQHDGLSIHGGDSQNGMESLLQTYLNGGWGFEDRSSQSTSHRGSFTTGNGRDAGVNPGATSTITSISCASFTCSVVTSNAVTGVQNGIWIVISGTTNYNGTYYTTGFTDTKHFSFTTVAPSVATENAGSVGVEGSTHLFANATRSTSDASCAAGQNFLFSQAAQFGPETQQGAAINVAGANTAGALLSTTITAVINEYTVQLATNCVTGVTNAQISYGGGISHGPIIATGSSTWNTPYWEADQPPAKMSQQTILIGGNLSVDYTYNVPLTLGINSQITGLQGMTVRDPRDQSGFVQMWCGATVNEDCGFRMINFNNSISWQMYTPGSANGHFFWIRGGSPSEIPFSASDTGTTDVTAATNVTLNPSTGNSVITNGNLKVTGGVTFAGIAGATQCLHVNTFGVVTGTGVDCGGGGGGVTGSGTNQSIAMWTGTTSLGNSSLTDNTFTVNTTEALTSSLNNPNAIQATNGGVVATFRNQSACSNPGSFSTINLACRAMDGSVAIPAGTNAGVIAGVYGDTNFGIVGFGGAPSVAGGYFVGILGVTGSPSELAGVVGVTETFNGGTGTVALASGVVGIGAVQNDSQADQLATILDGVDAKIYLPRAATIEALTADFYAHSPTLTGKSSHHYGLFIEDQTVGGAQNPDPWGIFEAGTAKNQLGGPLTLAGISGSVQCLHVNTNGLITGTGSDCGAGSSLAITVNSGSSLVSPVNFQSGTNTTASNPSGSNVQYNVATATNAVLGVIEINTDLGGSATAPTVVNGSHITNNSIPNSGLVNAATTVNGQTCTLGSTCTIPEQVNTVNMTSQNGFNLLTSTVNAVGLTVTPTNSATNQLKFEITGASYTGNAATATLAGNVTGIVAAANGGTGVASPTAHFVPIAEGSGPYTFISPGTAGLCLISNGVSADPTFQACGAGGGSSGGSQFAVQYNSNGTGGFAGITPPVTNGTYSIVYSVVGGVAVSPTAVLQGVPVDATNPATLLYSDRNSWLNWTTGTGLAIPAVATNFASSYHFSLLNTAGATLTMTPNAAAGDLCNGAATCTTLNNWFGIMFQDATSAPGHWFLNNLLTDKAMGATCSNGVTWSTTTGIGCLSSAPILVGATAGGDLSGSYPNPTVIAINGGTFSGTNGHLVSFGASNTPADSGLVKGNVVLAVSPGVGIAHFAGSTQTVTSSPVSLSADITGQLPIGNVGSAGLSGVGAVSVASTGAVSLVGAAGQILAGSTPAFTATPALGTDASVSGTLTLANGGGGGAHTIFGSAATTTNTILGPSVVIPNGHLVTCATSSTTCTLTDGGAPGGTGTVQVVGAGTLTSTALVTGGGTVFVQTPSATTTLDASGNLQLAAGGSMSSADTGTPKFTFSASKISLNQPLSIAVTSNQMVFGTTTNLTTLTFPASSGAVTVTMPNVTDTVAILGTAQTFSATETFSGIVKHTTNGASSASALQVLGTPFSGTGTTGTPLVYFDQATGSEPTTWGTHGTELGFNMPSGYTGMIVDSHLNGGSSLWSVDYQGNGILAGTLSVTGHVTLEGVTSAGATGTSNLVFSNSPTLVTPSLGTPSALTLTNATGLPVGGIASMAADTMAANMTSSSASPTAVTMPTTAHAIWLAEGTGSAPIASGTGVAGQPLISGGSSVDPAYGDLWLPQMIPAANCNNTTAGAGWSIPSGGTVGCRAGTNNLGGFITITDTSTTFAQFTTVIPFDWDSGSNPFIRFYFESDSDTTNGHTVIPQVKVSCSQNNNGTTTDDVTFTAAQSSSTVTFGASAIAHGFYSASNVQFDSTRMSGCVAGGLFIVQVGRATDTATGNINFYGASVTWPHKTPGTAQAN